MASLIRGGLALAALLSAMTVGACGGNVVVDSGPTGTGGATTANHTTSVGSTTAVGSTTTVGSTTGVSSTGISSSGGDPCSTGADCTQCPSFNDCFSCLSTKFPIGAMLNQALGNCVVCQACFTVCEGPMNGCAGPAPPFKSACDVGTPSMPGMGACGDGTTGCIACSLKVGGPCFAANQACQNDPQCSALSQAAGSCPMN